MHLLKRLLNTIHLRLFAIKLCVHINRCLDGSVVMFWFINTFSVEFLWSRSIELNVRVSTTFVIEWPTYTTWLVCTDWFAMQTNLSGSSHEDFPFTKILDWRSCRDRLCDVQFFLQMTNMLKETMWQVTPMHCLHCHTLKPYSMLDYYNLLVIVFLLCRFPM